jgi:hypothetical protein
LLLDRVDVKPQLMNSSFSFSRRGTREKVKANLAKELAKPDKADQTQINAAKLYVSTMIDALPKDFNACEVAANGEVCDGRFILQSVVVNGLKLDL